MRALSILTFITLATMSQAAWSTHRPILKDVGVLGLFSHDIFAWDREQSINTENGRVDLSTIFDWENGTRIDQGGNPKNAENAPVYTVTMELVEFYKNEMARIEGSEQGRHVEARKRTVTLFHSWVRASFERLTTMPFPRTGLNEAVNNDEQAAMRALHDILPGNAFIYRKLFPVRNFNVTNWLWARFRLNPNELNQTINTFNGDYDEEYKSIEIPFTQRRINLKETDKAFVEQFSELNFDLMLSELARVGNGDMNFDEVSLAPYLMRMAQKAICPTGNAWMPQKVTCN